MGRRSINTTKSGKYMNPTDQARKEARKKELKKNKRQRQMVRAAVLKNKDPAQILEEMEKIDEMEYNVLQPSPLNEKVLRDKRKKLKETFDRVMRLYHNDEPEHWADLKRKEVEYEKKRLKKQQYYESVKHAQSVQIDEIPLPSSTQAPPTGTTSGVLFTGPNRLPPPPTALSLPAFAPGAPPGVLKKPNDNSVQPSEKSSENKKESPGVPPNPPPDLFELKELDTDAEDDDVLPREYIPRTKSSKKSSSDAVSKPNALQQRMLAISGQNIDEFMKEMESVHRKKEKEREGTRSQVKRVKNDNEDNDDSHSTKSDGDDSNAASDNSDDENSEDENDKTHRKEDTKVSTANSSAGVALFPGTSTVSMPPSIAAPAALPHMSIPAPPIPPVTGITPPMLFRPPPLRPPGGMPNFGMRMPPGPPPGARPPSAMNLPPRMGIRMPPGPPPGLPPRMAHHHKTQQQHSKDMGKGVTTITAKPQIRNLSADVTRFVPSTLRVKREETKKPNRTKAFVQEPSMAETNKAVTKDDAYLQFMNEMQGLL